MSMPAHILYNIHSARSSLQQLFNKKLLAMVTWHNTIIAKLFQINSLLALIPFLSYIKSRSEIWLIARTVLVHTHSSDNFDWLLKHFLLIDKPVLNDSSDSSYLQKWQYLWVNQTRLKVFYSIKCTGCYFWKLEIVSHSVSYSVSN